MRTEDLLRILSEMTGRPVDVCRKQHLSRVKATAKIVRCARKLWGDDVWDRELTRVFGVSLLRTETPPSAVSVVSEREMFAQTFLKAFTVVASHLLLIRVRCPEGELENRTHVVWHLGSDSDVRVVVPNIVGAWQKPISRFVLTLFAYLHRVSTGRFARKPTWWTSTSSSSSSTPTPFSSIVARCARDEGLLVSTWARLVVDGAEHVRECVRTCGIKEGRAVCMRGGLADPETLALMRALVLDLPLNPSGKGWASPRQQHDLCVESGMQFFGNASVSWSAQLGLNATEDHRTRYEDVIARFVEKRRTRTDDDVVVVGLYARRDLPPGLPLGFGWDDRSADRDDDDDDDDVSNMRRMRVSTASSRSNVVVYAPCADVHLYCVGRRGIRAGTELTYNGRRLRPKHHGYYLGDA